MMICERCGKEMPDTAAVCPSCGTASSFARSGTATPTDYGQPSSAYPPSSYAQGYGQQPLYTPPQPDYAPQQNYGQSYNVPPAAYPPVSVNVNIGAPIVPVTPVASPGNSGAIIAEVLLNLFLGIYGVGWLMAGETTTGIILLVCGIFLYWPIMVLGTIFTLGIGLLCLGPLAIGAIILNAILLNNTIKRKSAYILVQQVQQVQTLPPR